MATNVTFTNEYQKILQVLSLILYLRLMKKLLSLINQISPIPQEDFEEFLPFTTEVFFNKKDKIYSVGESCEDLWIIESGLVKATYLSSDGNEFIRSFMKEGDIIATPYFEMNARIESRSNIIAMENTKVLKFKYEIMRHLVETKLCWLKLYIGYLEKYYFLKEDREYEFIALSATKRYENFCEKFPELLERVSQNNIASYLGITKFSLSRINREMKKNKKT